MENEVKLTGEVKVVNSKGFLFILQDSNETDDMFAHVSGFENPADFKKIESNFKEYTYRLAYNVKNGKKGPEASNVTILEENLRTKTNQQ